MKHANKDIDQQLRDLESKSLPDLSRIDGHWQQMKAQLAPATPAPAKVPVKYGGWILSAAALVVGVAVSLGIRSNRSKKQVTNDPVIAVVSAQTVPQDTVPAKKARPMKTRKTPKAPTTSTVPQEPKVVADTVIAKKAVPVKRSTEASKPTLKTSHKIPRKKKVLLKARTSDGRDTTLEATIIEEIEVRDTLKPTLEEFFSKLQKPAQHFNIKSDRDTLLMGEDGSAFFIPANTFPTNEDVTITLKEFFSYEDIITNRLFTNSGRNQLVTGGMIHLEVSVGGKKLDLMDGKKIKWFVPDTSIDMKDMELFEGRKGSNSFSVAPDNGTTSSGQSFIDWAPAYREFSNQVVTREVRVLDLRDLPMYTKESSGKAVFVRSRESSFSRKELKARLEEKYGNYYDRIIVRNQGSDNQKEGAAFTFGNSEKWGWLEYTSIGDTAWISILQAQFYKLPALDTMVLINGRRIQSASISSLLNRVAGNFSVDIQKLGWINCDRFYKNRNLVEFAINLDDDASRCFTVLVFERFKSILPGVISGKKVVFQGVPAGEPVQIICVRQENGRIVRANRSLKLSRTTISDMQFEDITPEEFRKEAARMDK